MSRASSDSISGTVSVGDIAIKGTRGTQISLALSADRQLLDAIPRDQLLLVTIDGKQQALALTELISRPAIIYRFDGAGIVRVKYGLFRGPMRSIPSGSVRLTQIISSGEVVEANRPWVTASGSYASNVTTASSCVIAASAANICGIDVTVDPFIGQTNVGGTFQSNEGNGVSGTITITFSAPVNSITVTVYDPTFPGNVARAYDVNGVVLGSVFFTYSGTGGVNVPNQRTIARAGIRTVELIPAKEDYVAYDATFDTLPVPPGPPPCPALVVAGSPPVTTQYGAVDATHPKPHLGRDYSVPTGTPIYSSDSGTVRWASPAGSAGIAVIVQSANVSSYFFHLQSASVSPPQVVRAGQLLGHSGNTGHSTAPHLHFEQHSPASAWPWDASGHVPRATAIAPCTN